MTDITELAQSWKTAAHKAKQANDLYLEGKITLSECVVETRDYLDYSDNPNNFLALVEALEKAQAVMNAVVTAAAIRGVRPFDGIDCDPPTLEENAEACGDAMSARIRELEANPPKPHHNGLMQISNELASAKQRIAELESRTVTVKLPEVRITVAESRRRNMTWRELGAYNEGADVAAERIGKELTAQGIKWEAE